MVLIVAILNDGVSSTKHGFYDSFEYTDAIPKCGATCPVLGA